MHSATRIAPAILALFAVTFWVTALDAPAAAGTRASSSATIRVSAQVIRVAGRVETLEASARLIEEFEALRAGATGAAVGLEAIPERLVANGLVRLSLAAEGHPPAGGAADLDGAMPSGGGTPGAQVLVEYVAN